MISYILINTEPNKEHSVYLKLIKMSGNILEVNPLFGQYDMIAKVECDDADKLGEFILNDIKKIEGVVDTKTLVGYK